MDAKDLQNQVHRRTLAMRNIERIVCCEIFANAFEGASARQQFEIYMAIEEEDVDKLRGVLKILLQDTMTLRQLRDRAQELRVRQYSRLGKEDLLIAIQAREAANGVG